MNDLNLLNFSRCSRGLDSDYRQATIAEKVQVQCKNRKASSLLRMRLEICLDQDLDGLFAGINFDTDRRIAEIDSCRRPFFPRIMA